MEKNLKTATFIVGIVLLVSLTVLVNLLISNENLKSKFIGLDKTHLPTIQLKGEGTVYAVPDTAEISFTVLTEGDDTETALSENNRKMDSVISYLKEEGVDESDIQTSGFNIRPLQNRKEDPLTRETRLEIYGYQVRNTVEVELKDLEKADTVIDGAVRAGANEVNRFQFQVSDEEEYKAEARRKAIKETKEKGEEIASALGVSLGRVIAFSEDTRYIPFVRTEMEIAADREIVSSEATPVEPGENEIKVNVTVKYEIR